MLNRIKGNKAQRVLVKQFAKFLIIGGIAFLINIVIFVVFYNLAEVNYLLSTAAAFLAALVFNYILNVNWVFKKAVFKVSRFATREFAVFALISVLGLTLHLTLVYVFVEKAQIYPTLANVLSSAIVMIWNFVMRKIILFSENNE